MNPAFVIFGIQATLRAAQAGADLLGEHARDRKVFLPDLELPPGSKSEQLIQFLKENPQLANSKEELRAIWDDEHKELKTEKAALFDPAYAVMLERQAKSQLLGEGKDENEAKRDAGMLAAGRMVEQWRQERKPPNAFVRMALTLTDIGLEFVGSNPSILGIGSRGEKLIAAFAMNMSDLFPNDVADFGPEANFADRVLGIFLRSGLGALCDNASTAFEDEDIARLLTGIAKPIVKELPGTIEEQFNYRRIVDALAGPAAEAAFSILAEDTGAYLGKRFSDDRALGAVTSALFKELKNTTHDGTIVDVFGEKGLIRFYKAGLGVAAERPELFVGDDQAAKGEMFRKMLSGAANTLREHTGFDAATGSAFAAMVVEEVGTNAPAILRHVADEPWEKVAATLLSQVAAELSSALANSRAFELFSSSQLVEFARTILSQAAQTPGMLGANRSEVQAIVAGVARAMAADDNFLLSADEWIAIAGAAAKAAAAEPGRLFNLSINDPDDALFAKVVETLLEQADQCWTAAGRDGRPALFGETLQSIVATTIEALTGNISALANQPDIAGRLIQLLLSKASGNPEKFGSRGLLEVFQAFVKRALASGQLPTDQEIDEVLSA